MNRTTCMLLILFLCVSSVAFATEKYQVMEVKNGGAIEGTAVFAGAAIPKDETLTLTSEIELCGKTLPAERYLINSQRKIKNVVVYIENIESGKSFSTTELVVNNAKCAFVPHVSVGFKVKGNKIVIKNGDPVFHNVHSYIEGKTIYNLGLPDQGSSATKSLMKSGIMEAKCDSHPWMLGYVHIFNNPYAAVTNENGEFVITDIPSGIYAIGVWHEALGTMKIENVKVEAGKVNRIKLEYGLTAAKE